MNFQENQQKVIDNPDDWENHWRDYAYATMKNPAQSMRHHLLLDEINALGTRCNLLIDIGSGVGDFLKMSVQAHVANEYIGFEISEMGVDISRHKVPEAIFYQVDLYSPPKEVIPYIAMADVVVCSEVIEHVDDPIEFCRRIKAYVKPGGKLLLTVPGGPMSSFDKHIGHRTHFNRASIDKLLTAAGFNVDKIHLSGFPFFNLYRLLVLFRGKRLITDIKSNQGIFSRVLSNLMMGCFRVLFFFNMRHSLYGWQVIVSASRPEGPVL